MEEKVIELTPNDVAEALERGARKRLRMSAAEMIRRFKAGELDDIGNVMDLIILAGSLDECDPLHV